MVGLRAANELKDCMQQAFHLVTRFWEQVGSGE
jgi:hypothetical protein